MFRKLFLLILSCTLPLLGRVENSILPLMDHLAYRDLTGKINAAQQQAINEIRTRQKECLRVVSFNMLFNLPWTEKQLDMDNRWVNRKARLIEYFLWANADIIGSQELQKNQLDALMAVVKDRYGYYGKAAWDGKEKGDIPAIFFRKERLELLEGKTYSFSDHPEEICVGPYGTANTFTVCYFRDLLTNHVFQVVNTHLAFGNIKRRAYEANKLKDYLCQQNPAVPLILTGDFNTFPFRQDLDLPFFDGEQILDVIEAAGIKDSQKKALYGHLGPISSSNFCEREKKSFSSLGTPGVILDHIFVNDLVTILSHGIDPATVNGSWPSDHFPVIVDCILNY